MRHYNHSRLPQINRRLLTRRVLEVLEEGLRGRDIDVVVPLVVVVDIVGFVLEGFDGLDAAEEGNEGHGGAVFVNGAAGRVSGGINVIMRMAVNTKQ